VYSISYNGSMKEILYYTTQDGKCPFLIWRNKLDNSIKSRIMKRLERIQDGNYGDCKKIDNNISELRYHFGSGYRIYFTERNDTLVILLCAGDKSSQSEDIKLAKLYFKDLER